MSTKNADGWPLQNLGKGNNNNGEPTGKKELAVAAHRRGLLEQTVELYVEAPWISTCPRPSQARPSSRPRSFRMFIKAIIQNSFE